MAKGGDYKISDIYQGGYSSLKPPSGWTSDNYIKAGDLSMTTDPRNANILQEVSSKLSAGLKNIEVTAIQPEILDAIPNEQLKEVRRLAKLTGIDVSMHGPLIEASGITQQGFNEVERESAERKIAHALIRSRELNPDGNIPVTFHSTNGAPGSQLLPPSERGKEDGNYRRMVAVNRENGKAILLEPEVEYRPGGEIRETKRLPEDRLDSANHTEWKNSIFQVEVQRENAERILQDVHPLIIARFAQVESGKISSSELSPQEREQMRKVSSAFEFIDQARQSANSLFSKAHEIAKADKDNEKIKILQEISKRYGDQIGIKKEGDKESMDIEAYYNPKIYSDALHDLTRSLEKFPPKTYITAEDFVVGKSSQTYGNAAFKAFQEFKGKNVPIMVIENPPAGAGLSTGEDIARIVQASRDQFVNVAVKEGMSDDEAKRQAEKLIGATWDVGHINMLRGQGYSEKDIIKETETVAPYVKHVHLSDNFGMEHTELPMGMGNVPLKEMMDKLGEKGFEAKKVIEAASWWQHMKSSPFQESLEGIGSPVYQMDMAPYWNQAGGLYQGYMSGLDGAWLPQTNYETFGTSFSRLPKELGGNTQQGQGNRMSGRPME
ncbi:MAG: TIM barrel protein [Nanoarchaeota archaeon]|nr:TIM barrel protein [Nanoarchaeota archaeon]